MPFRIAVGQISSESNHFVPGFCEIDFFRNTGYLLEGEEMFTLAGTTNEVAGALGALTAVSDVAIVPLLAARANSSKPLSAACYAELAERLLAALRTAGAIDGVFLSHHGSMATETEDDPEGAIAEAVREMVGPSVPIVMTLDLHGNVTRRMVEHCNAILGYEHYPHDDVFSTGARGATLLLRAVRGEVKPVIGHARLPLILTGFHGSTQGDGPFALLMRDAKTLETTPGVLSTSLFFVGSYIDIPDMGCSALVVTDNDRDQATGAASRLAYQFWQRRHAFTVDVISVAEAVRRGREIAGGPVLLLDTADTTGGGASGDGIGLVRGLLAAGVNEPCLAMVVDPEAVQVCLQHGAGSEVTLHLGHKVDPQWGEPLRVTGKVLRSLDGRFCYTGGILGGSWASMGPSVVLQIGNIQVLVMSLPTYDWADEQYRAAALQPEQAKFVGVKNMMNFRSGYGDVMKGYFVLDLPGPTPADMRQLPFRRIARPTFPLDEGLSKPDILLSTSK